MSDFQNKIESTHILPICIENLSLAMQGRKLLNNITCTINPQGITVILGPNGAGKSLFLRCLHGLEHHFTGSIKFNGKIPKTNLRTKQSLVFQTPILLRRTVQENLHFVLKQRGIRDKSLTSAFLVRLKLDHLTHSPARLLSGGEKQRLALARALITKPGLLLLDEATSNLDPSSTEMIEEILKSSAAENTKIIFVTHDIVQAKRLADDVIFLNRGNICEHTASRVFFSKPNSIEAQSFVAGKIVLPHG